MANYLENEDLVRELKKSREQSKPTAELVEMFKLIATRYSRKYHYDNPMDREDCISTAVEIMIKKYDRFDFNLKTDAFSYYTQVANNGLKFGWNELNNKKSKTFSIDAIFKENI